MIRRKLLISSVLWLPVLAGGCRSAKTDNYVELVNAEKRALEDRIYDWEYEYEILEDELEKCRQENERLRRNRPEERFGPDRDTPSGRDSYPDDDLPDISPPSVDFGVPADPPDNGTGGADPPDDSVIPEPPDRQRMPDERRQGSQGGQGLEDTAKDPEELPNPRISDAHDRIESLAIHPLHSQGADFDGKPGDDGLKVVLQPRNAANQLVPRAGPVTLALLDPAQEGQDAVVGRWSFAAPEVGRNLKRRGGPPGIHLHVTWEGRKPGNSPLRLFARYETEDGRQIESQREVFVRLSDATAAWTPRRSASDAAAISIAQRADAAKDGRETKPAPSADGDGSEKTSASNVPDTTELQEQKPPARPQWSPNR